MWKSSIAVLAQTQEASQLFNTINLFPFLAHFRGTSSDQTDCRGENLRQLAFEDLPPRKALHVMSIGAWTNQPTGERLIERGKDIENISLIIYGRVRVSRGERVLGELAAGDIVGSALLLSGAPADVDAVVVEPVRAMRWEVQTMERFLAANPETRITMLRHLSRDLAEKIGLVTRAK